MIKSVGCSEKTPLRNSTWGHIFNHLPKINHKRFERTTVTYQEVTIGTSHLYPGAQIPDSSESNLAKQRKGHKSFRVHTHKLREQISGCIPALGIFYADKSFVVIEDWHPIIKNAWRLEKPPTPEEYANSVFMSPTTSYWISLRKPHIICARSAFHWYTAGASVPILMWVYGYKTERDFFLFLSTYLNYALKQPRFALWALATDLTPAIHSPEQAVAAIKLYAPESSLTKKGKSVQQSSRLHEIMQDPYIKAQFRTGRAFNPLPRPKWRKGLVWTSVQQKFSWLESDHPDAAWLRYRQTAARERIFDPNFVRYKVVRENTTFSCTPTSLKQANEALPIRHIGESVRPDRENKLFPNAIPHHPPPGQRGKLPKPA